MSLNEFILIACAIALPLVAILAAVSIGATFTERHADARVYVRIGPEASIEISGYPLKKANRLAHQWVAGAPHLLQIPDDTHLVHEDETYLISNNPITEENR